MPAAHATHSPIDALRRDLLAEALDVARTRPAAERDPLLAEVAMLLARHDAFADGEAVAMEIAAPVRRAKTLGEIAMHAPRPADAARLRAALRALVESQARAAIDADTACALVTALADAGDLDAALALRARLDVDDADALLVSRLLREGRRGDALDLASRAGAGTARDELLLEVADIAAAYADREVALCAAEAIGDPYVREEARMTALAVLAGDDATAAIAAVLDAVRDPLSMLHALATAAGHASGAGDDPTACALARVAARVAMVVPTPFREHALHRASTLLGEVGDASDALQVARRMAPGDHRALAIESAFWRLGRELGLPDEARAFLAHAHDDAERDAAIAVLVGEYLDAGAVASARRWTRRVVDPARRASLEEDLADVVADRRLEARIARVGSVRALGEAPADTLSSNQLWELAAASLRAGDDAGVLGALEALEAREAGAWGAWRIGGLAARHGEVAALRTWAQATLPDAWRVSALAGAVAWAGVPPDPDDDGGPPFDG